MSGAPSCKHSVKRQRLSSVKDASKLGYIDKVIKEAL